MLPALALMALSAGLNAHGDRRVARATSGVMADDYAAKSRLQRQQMDEVLGTARSMYAPLDRNRRYEEAASTSEQKLAAGLEGVVSEPADPVSGAMSKDYLVARAARTAEQAGAIAKLARLMARSGAASEVDREDSMTEMQSSDRLAEIAQRLRDREELTRAYLERAGSAGDNHKLLGSLAQLGGSIYGMSGGAARAGSAASAAPSVRSTGMFIFPNN